MARCNPAAELKAITDAFTLIITLISDFQQSVSKLCEAELQVLHELRHKRSKQCCDARQILLDLLQATHVANDFTEQVKKVLWHCKGSEKLRRIKRDIRLNQWQSLEDHLKITKKELSECECHYERFVHDFKEIQSRLISAELLTEDLKLQASQKRIKTQVGGTVTTVGLIGVATGGVIATVTGVGTAVSLISTPLTFGIGAPVGMAVTGATVAAASGAGAIATAGVTIYIDRKYQKLIRAYQAICTSLCAIEQSSGLILYQSDGIKAGIDRIGRAVNDISWYKSELGEEERVCDALTYLSKSCDEFYPTLCQDCQSVKKYTDCLVEKLQRLY